jgi:hypothetical protein
MTPEEFVAAIEKAVLNPAAEGTVRQLAEPSGRAPSERALRLHDWYAKLDEEDKTMVADAVREGAHSATFGFLCVLDGVRQVDDPPHVSLRLAAIAADGEETLLNEPAHDLHDLLQAGLS